MKANVAKDSNESRPVIRMPSVSVMLGVSPQVAIEEVMLQYKSLMVLYQYR